MVMDNTIVKKSRKNIFKVVKVRDTLLSIGVGETEQFKMSQMNYNSAKVTASNIKSDGIATFEIKKEEVKPGRKPKRFEVTRLK